MTPGKPQRTTSKQQKHSTQCEVKKNECSIGNTSRCKSNNLNCLINPRDGFNVESGQSNATQEEQRAHLNLRKWSWITLLSVCSKQKQSALTPLNERLVSLWRLCLQPLTDEQPESSPSYTATSKQTWRCSETASSLHRRTLIL